MSIHFQIFLTMAVSMLEDALSVWTKLGQHLQFVWLCVSSIKTGRRRIIRLNYPCLWVLNDALPKDSSSRRIMRLVPVFILETHNQTNYKCWPNFVQTDNASSSIKTADYAFRASVVVLVCMIARFLLFPMLYSAQCLLVKSGSVMPVFLFVWIAMGFF